jgi:hypothetical protein
MDLIGSNNWNRFKSVIRSAHDTFNGATVIWHRSVAGLDRWKEDNTTEQFELITLKALFQFNDFRTWPVTFTTETGKMDKESKVMWLNRQYLQEMGYLNASGEFDYNPGADRFEYNGVMYFDMGYTEISQAFDDPQHLTIILKRDVKATGS